MPTKTPPEKYATFVDDHFEKLTLREVVAKRNASDNRQDVWSGRLSTGIFGRPNCRSVNKPNIPKGGSEVMLALGDGGLKGIIELGFVPCPACHPERTPNFWERSADAINCRHPNLSQPQQILDRNLVSFDASQVDWEEVAKHLPAMPNRLYVPPGLSADQVNEIRNKIRKLGFDPPQVGCYDPNAPGRFRRYEG